jgi:hypothetical protein
MYPLDAQGLLSSHAWHFKFRETAGESWFCAVQCGSALKTKKIHSFLNNNDGEVFMVAYVDDMLIAAPTQAAVSRVQSKVIGRFDARDMGQVKFFLGMSIMRHRGQSLLWLHQGRYARDIVACRTLNGFVSQWVGTPSCDEPMPEKSQAVSPVLRWSVD